MIYINIKNTRSYLLNLPLLRPLHRHGLHRDQRPRAHVQPLVNSPERAAADPLDLGPFVLTNPLPFVDARAAGVRAREGSLDDAKASGAKRGNSKRRACVYDGIRNYG